MILSEKNTNFISSIYETHLDNIKNIYKVSPHGKKPIMPLTNFIFEFFIFNSLYQIDWMYSYDNRTIIYHDRESENENNQIAKFLKFIRNNNQYGDSLLIDCFEPLKHISAEGEWTKIVEDERIKIEDGENFFRKLTFIKNNQSKFYPTKANFKLIKSCLYFIGNVRNNIFHGSKTEKLLDEESQLRRLEIYDIFIKCVNALFFAITILEGQKEKISSYKIQIPITSPRIASARILELINKREGIKVEDSRLINHIATTNFKPNLGDTLFYPSAGYDIITPTIIALEHINDFYFYNESYDFRKLGGIKKDLEKILNLDIDYDKGKKIFSFNFSGSKRILHFIANDNKTFLKKEEVNLGFYFHRGDSNGEGGSDQKWDSDLLPELMNKIKSSNNCFFITDGHPGGLSNDLNIIEKIKLKKTERNREYYIGYLK